MPFTVSPSSYIGGQLFQTGLTNLGQDMVKMMEKIEEGQKQDASSTLLMQQALQTGAIDMKQWDEFLAAPRAKRIGMAATIAGDWIGKQRKAQAELAQTYAQTNEMKARTADYLRGPEEIEFPLGVRKATVPTEQELAAPPAGAIGPTPGGAPLGAMQSDFSAYQAAMGAAPPSVARFVRYRGSLHPLAADAAAGPLEPIYAPGTKVVIGYRNPKTGGIENLNEAQIQAQLPKEEQQPQVQELTVDGRKTGKVAAIWKNTMHVFDQDPETPGLLYDEVNDVYGYTVGGEFRPADAITQAQARAAKAKREAAAAGAKEAPTPAPKKSAGGGLRDWLIALGIGKEVGTPSPKPSAPPSDEEMPTGIREERSENVVVDERLALQIIDEARMQLGPTASKAAIAARAKEIARGRGLTWPER